MASKMKNTKGERLNIRFNRKIKLEFHGAKLTSDGGLLAYRELDEALGLFNSTSTVMNDKRTGRNIQHDMTNLLRQFVLSVDPVMRAVTGKKKRKNAASVNTVGRFETEILSQKKNLDGLSEINGSWVQKVMEKTSHHRVILDMDSSESPVHGEQEGSAYNGHFGSHCYHPLFCFNQYGDCEGAMLSPGNVYSADRWRELLEPIVRRCENKKVRKYFRSDAAFAKPEIYEYLEENGLLYAIRFPANDVLYDEIKHLLIRPIGRPSRKPVVWFHDFKYQAASWQKRRSPLLQWTRYCRAVDKRRQVCS